MIWLKKLMRRVTPAELAAQQLADAELELLAAHVHREYGEAEIGKFELRVKRLRKFLAELERKI